MVAEQFQGTPNLLFIGVVIVTFALLTFSAFKA